METQIQTTLQFHLTPLSIRGTNDNKLDWMLGKEPLYSMGGCSKFGNQSKAFYRT